MNINLHCSLKNLGRRQINQANSNNFSDQKDTVSAGATRTSEMIVTDGYIQCDLCILTWLFSLKYRKRRNFTGNGSSRIRNKRGCIAQPPFPIYTPAEYAKVK